MSDVKRYWAEMFVGGFYKAHRVVLASDYDALAQRCAELERDLATAHADASHYASRADELRAEADRYRAAWDLWHEKTDWVQQAITEGALPDRYLGMHRADILRAEVERLRQALVRIYFQTKAYADDCRGMPEYSTLVVAEIARTALETTK